MELGLYRDLRSGWLKIHSDLVIFDVVSVYPRTWHGICGRITRDRLLVRINNDSVLNTSITRSSNSQELAVPSYHLHISIAITFIKILLRFDFKQDQTVKIGGGQVSANLPLSGQEEIEVAGTVLLTEGFVAESHLEDFLNCKDKLRWMNMIYLDTMAITSTSLQPRLQSGLSSR